MGATNKSNRERVPSLLRLLVPLLGLSMAVHVAARPFSGKVDSRQAPGLSAETWVGSEPLSMEALRGRVVLVEFWTFGCRNCRNIESIVKGWHERYADAGLVVLAVHTPDFGSDFGSESEKNVDRVRDYVREQGIAYAVPIDGKGEISRAFGNGYWPALYLIDRQGQIRHVRIGEGGGDEMQARIEALLSEPARG